MVRVVVRGGVMGDMRGRVGGKDKGERDHHGGNLKLMIIIEVHRYFS